MALTDYSTLTFDCYGTLIDWESGILHALRETLPGIPVSTDEILETFARFEAEEEATSPTLLYPQILNRVFHRLARAWHLETREDQARAFGDSVPSWPAFPDSPDALARLKKHYRLVILSNIDRDSFADSQARLGVDFDFVFTAQDIGSYKPEPRNFEFMLAQLEAEGIARHQILHTAQSLFHDHLPASRLGLDTCWIDRRHDCSGWGATPPPSQEVETTYRFTRLADLATAVQEEVSEI